MGNIISEIILVRVAMWAPLCFGAKLEDHPRTRKSQWPFHGLIINGSDPNHLRLSWDESSKNYTKPKPPNPPAP